MTSSSSSASTSRPGFTGPAGARGDLVDTIEAQRFGCEMSGSPLYAEILAALGRDVEEGGTTARILAPYAGAPFGDAIPLRLLAGLHELVLRGEAPALAEHFPSVGGQPGRHVAATALAVVEANQAALKRRMKRGVQTNEVGRSTSLLPGYLALGESGLPLRILEVGASAGLNLWFDQFRYRGRAEAFGPVDSPVVFDRPFAFGEPDLSAPLQVAERRGCDLAPIDPTTDDGRIRLRSHIWPDQPERRARLDAALEVAAGHPPLVEASGGVAWLERVLAEPVEGVTTVVVHTIVLQYLPTDERRRLIATIEQAGIRASRSAPLAWLRMEPGGDQAEVRLTTWPDGGSRLVARSSFHGPPVVLA